MSNPVGAIGQGLKGLGEGLGKATQGVGRAAQAVPSELPPQLPKVEITPEIGSIPRPEIPKPNPIDVKAADSILTNAKAEGIKGSIKNLAEGKFNAEIKNSVNQAPNISPESIQPNKDISPITPAESGSGKPPEVPRTTLADQPSERNPLEDLDYMAMREASIRYGAEEAAKVHQELQSGNPAYNSAHLDTAIDFGRLKAQTEFVAKFPQKAQEIAKHDPHLRRILEIKELGARETVNAATNKDITTVEEIVKPHSTSPESGEIITERSATFGSFEVQENLNADLLDPEELETYQKGFDTLQRLIDSATPDQKKLLLSAQVSSSIVGLQPILGLNNKHEAAAIYNAFERAGINFRENYSFYRYIDPKAGVDGYQPDYLLVNDRAAEQVLRANKDTLPLNENFIELPSDKSLTKQELADGIAKLFNSDDGQVRHLTYGLMSGFPKEEVQNFIEIPEIKAQVRDRVLTKTEQYDKLQNYDPTQIEFDLYRKAFLPDNRVDPGAKNFASGFGLTWRTSSVPPSEATLNQAQKLLQIDRSLVQTNGRNGYLDYFEKQGVTTQVAERMFTQASSIPQYERDLIYPNTKVEDMLPVVELGLFGFTSVGVEAGLAVDASVAEYLRLQSLIEKSRKEREKIEEERKKLEALMKKLEEEQQSSEEEKSTMEMVQGK